MATLDDLMSAAPTSFKFEHPGDTVSGTITAITVRQATEYGTGKPLVWDDGNPCQQIVVSLATDAHDSPTDDGIRAVYIKAWGVQIKAFRAAIAAAGKPECGDLFMASFTQYGPRSAVGNAAKEYVYQISKQQAPGLDAVLGGPVQPAPAPVAVHSVPPAAPAPVAPVAQTPAQIAKSLASLGMPVESIAAQLGLPVDVAGMLISS